MIFYFIFGGLFLFAFFSVFIWSLKNGISPMPTSPKSKRAILQLIDTEIPKNLKGDIVELGSGFLTMGFSLARRYPKEQLICYETSPVPYFLSKITCFFLRVPNVQLLRQDLFTADLKNVKIIYCYLYPKAMEALRLKFEKELTPGTFIISNTFAIPGWKPVKILTVKDLYNTKIYLYQI